MAWEALRYKTELNESKERIESLLQQLEPEAARKPVTRKLTRRASHVEKEVVEEVTAGAFEEIQEKLEELLGQLNLEERQRMLAQVVEWFDGHKPAAQKDMAVLERADKECLRRECERAWAALGTEDRLRKRERNTVRQVQQFVQSVAEEYNECESDSEDLTQFDQRLLRLTDTQLQLELAELRRSISKKEKEVAQIMLNIAERGNFLNASSLSKLREEAEKQDDEISMDLVEEQEKVWIAADAELRRLQEQKDLIFDAVSFVKGRMKGNESKIPLNEEMAYYLKKKRAEVEATYGPSLLARRLEEHGRDLEPPNLEQLLRLRGEAEELNQRIQLALALNLKVSSDTRVVLDFEESVAALKEGAAPNVETLVKLESILDPTKDWSQDMVAEEDRRGVQIETERLAKKKTDLHALVVRMMEEQTALQREWAEQYASLKSSEDKLEKQEQLVPREEESFAEILEQHELVATALACARSDIHPLALPSRVQPSRSRRPSRTASQAWNKVARDEDNESVASSASFPREASSSSGASAGAVARPPRTQMVDMSHQVPVWSADAVVAGAVGELLNKRHVSAEWVDAFHEDPTGRIRKSALAAQTALFSHLEKEQDGLKLEVEELEQQLQQRLDGWRPARSSKVMDLVDESTEVASAAVADMERHLQRLRGMASTEPARGDLPSRLSNLQRCKAFMDSDRDVAELPPVLRPIREAILLEDRNAELRRQITSMGPEVATLRADFGQFKRAIERKRRLSPEQNAELKDRERDRALRQSCRELNLLREKVKHAQADAEAAT